MSVNYSIEQLWDNPTTEAAFDYLERLQQQGKIDKFRRLNSRFFRYIFWGRWIASTKDSALLVQAFPPFYNRKTGQMTRYFQLTTMPIELAKSYVVTTEK